MSITSNRREALAVAGHDCPACRSEKGRPCTRLSPLRAGPARSGEQVRHPHKQRVALVVLPS